jgi:hypothetical protein
MPNEDDFEPVPDIAVDKGDSFEHGLRWTYYTAKTVGTAAAEEYKPNHVEVLMTAMFAVVATLIHDQNQRIIDLENRLAGGYKGDRK